MKPFAIVPQGWVVEPKQNLIRLIAPSQVEACCFAQGARRGLVALSKRLGVPVQIVDSGLTEPIATFGEQVPASAITPTIQLETDLDLGNLYSSDKPTYINAIEDQTNLWCNLAALQAQGKKPQEFLIVQNAFALNFEEELSDRMNFLEADNQLREYSYRALRWYQEPDARIWRRREMNFVSSFWKIEYLGQPCWLGQVLSAQPADRFAAGEVSELFNS
jgi:hypothetical protein